MMRRIAWLAALLLLAGCSQGAMIDKVVSPVDQRLAKEAIGALARRDDAAVIARLAPRLRPLIGTRLAVMRAMLPRRIATMTIADARWQTGPQGTSSLIAYEVAGEGRWALVRIGIGSGAGDARITGFYVNPLRQSLAVNAFALRGKGAAAYLVLLGALFAVTTILIALTVLWRTPGVTRRWLWTIGMVFGVGRVAVDWSSERWDVFPITFQLFGAAAMRIGLLGPWIVSFGIPVVAIWFLVRRWQGSWIGQD